MIIAAGAFDQSGQTTPWMKLTGRVSIWRGPGSGVLILEQRSVTDQYVGGGVTTQSLTGCSVLVKRSRGTLLLTTGPFETAPNTPVTIVVSGR